MIKKTEKRNPYMGSSVDEFFADNSLLEEIEAAAVERLISLTSKHDREGTVSTTNASRWDT